MPTPEQIRRQRRHPRANPARQLATLPEQLQGIGNALQSLQQPPTPGQASPFARAFVGMVDVLIPGSLAHFDAAFTKAAAAVIPPPAPVARVELERGADGVYRPKQKEPSE